MTRGKPIRNMEAYDAGIEKMNKNKEKMKNHELKKKVILLSPELNDIITGIAWGNNDSIQRTMVNLLFDGLRSREVVRAANGARSLLDIGKEYGKMEDERRRQAVANEIRKEKLGYINTIFSVPKKD